MEAEPEEASACNNLAWVYATAPEPLRNLKAALPLAEKAVRIEPKDAIYRNTLGVVYYRLGKYREAVETLRSNLDNPEYTSLAIDLYFLAMSHQQLGETTRARDYYEWAVRWRRLQPRQTDEVQEELALFHTEASMQLGIKPGK